MAKAEVTYKTVKMDDERIVEFAGKRKMLKTSIFTDEATQVRLDFVNGETRLFTIPVDMVAKFAAHGAEQKLGDEIAGLEDVEDCILAVDGLMDRLNTGEWGIKRDGNGLSGTSVLVRALVQHTGKTVEAIKTFLAGKTQAEKNALRSNPKIKPLVEAIEAEKASKKTSVDTDSMLDELA